MTPAEVVVRRVRQHFSRHAEEYDHYAVVQKSVVRRLLELMPSLTREAGPVLDLGTGTGELAARFSTLHPHLPLLLADIAHGMTRHAASSVPGALAFDADAAALPLLDDCCGLVLSSSMYQWVNDLSGAFVEVGRILRPGGLFVCALFGAGTLRELRSAHEQALVESGQGHASHMQQFPTQEEVAAALHSAGFVAEIGGYEEIERHPDVATLLHNLKRIGAQNATMRRSPGLAERRVTLRMMSLYAERFGSDGMIPASYEVICIVARKL